MSADISRPVAVTGATRDDVRSDVDVLRTIAIAAGMAWAILFVVVGVVHQLEMYADGSIFSYSVAVRDGWAFHWHNIPGRLFVYFFCHLPAETYVALTGDARGAIALYGLLFFAAPLLGLAATFAADRSKGRVIFGYACLSTACLCPLVFGFPTEMWMAHALFWPALAVCHDARGGIGRTALVFAALLALVFTHEGALIFAATILATLLLRGRRDAAFRRAAAAFLVALSIWLAVKAELRPDDYFARILPWATLNFIDVDNLANALCRLLLGALAGYGLAFLVLRRLAPAKAHLGAASIIAVALAAYWLLFDHALHTDHRYYMRTALLVATPLLGALAAVQALHADGRLEAPFLPRGIAVPGDVAAQAIAGAILLVMLVHTVETVKFVRAWNHYKAAVRALAMGAASDPELGDARFVSSDRIRADLGRLSWSSTTPFLSVLVARKFAPARLVVDPTANYFWLSCKTASANEAADRVIRAEARGLVRTHACLHR
jgi:hypothetical protein